MSTIEIWWIGIALAMDCFAVSIASGIKARKILIGIMASMILAFGLFQGGFFLTGYVGTCFISSHISAVGKWIAVGLLGFLGAKMIWDDVKPGASEETGRLSYKTVPILAVATSIDALAVGVSFSCMENMSQYQIAYAAAVITFCSSLLSAIGLALGIYIGEKIHFPTSFIGGIILIFIAIKMIIEYFTQL